MMRADHQLKRLILIVGDLVSLYAALVLALALRYSPRVEGEILFQHLTPFSGIFLLWILFFAAFGLYDLRVMKNSRYFLYHLIRVVAINTALTIVILYLLPFFEIEPRRNLLLIAVSATVLLFLWRSVFNLVIRSPASRILFFGTSREAVELTDYLFKNPQLGLKPVGFLSGSEEDLCEVPFGLPCFSSQDKLKHVIRDTRTDMIVVPRDVREDRKLVDLLFRVIPLGVGVVEFPAFYERLIGKIPLSLIGKAWFLENLVGVRKQGWEFVKRTLDILLALSLAIPTALLFPVISIAIKLDSSGPVFFHQTRVGRHGRRFSLLKFRSMVENAEALGGQKGNGSEPDPRLTRVGAFLRRSYLDELPQTWNIFKGEMSFVGPRPERPEYIEELKKKIPFYQMRLLVPPGLTGWAQIHMENDASVEDAPEKMQYDLYYIKNRSLILELLIVLRTIFTLLQRQGR